MTPAPSHRPAASSIRALRELIDAIDRRLPHMESAGETAIASEAAALKDRALDRLAELTHEHDRVERA
jgi:hypothetical protein